MAISPLVAGSNHVPYSVQWLLKNPADPSDPGTPLDLSDLSAQSGLAALTCVVHPDGGTSRPGTGRFQVTSATNGEFVYYPTAADVVAGRFHLQFTATYSDGTVETCDAVPQIIEPAL